MQITKPLVIFELAEPIQETISTDGAVILPDTNIIVQNGQAVNQYSPDYKSYYYVDSPESGHHIAGSEFVYHGCLVPGQSFIIFYLPDNEIQYIAIEGRKNVHEFFFRVPENAVALSVSEYLADENSPEYRLDVTYFRRTDITKYVDSWTDLEIKQERDGLSSVYVEVANKIRVVKNARKQLKDLVEEKGLHAKMYFNVFLRHYIRNEYTLAKSIYLDFESYDLWGNFLEIDGSPFTIQSYLKSIGKNKFDILVDDIREDKKWNYDRIALESNVKWIIPTDLDLNYEIGVAKDYMIPMTLNIEEVVPNAPTNPLIRSQEYAILPASQRDNFFARTSTDGFLLNIRIKLKAELNAEKWFLSIDGLSSGAMFNSTGWDGNKSYVEIDTTITKVIPYRNAVIKFTVNFDIHDSGVKTLQFTSFDNFSISYTTKGEEMSLDIIKPEILGQKLIDLIAPNKGFKIRVDWKEDFSPMLCAAETIRGFKKAHVHASFEDLLNWFDVFGYEYAFLDDHTIHVRPRDDFFEPNIIAMELSEKEFAGLRIVASPDYANTSITIGYDKQDYGRSTNGRYEPNTVFEYSSGYVNREENTLELISPYRADSVGIELLTWQRGKDSTDDKSDNDLFILALSENDNGYSVYNGISMQVENVQLFNAALSPYFLVLRNESRLGIISQKLSFTGTNGNREAIISSGANIYADIPIAKKLFEPFVFSFATSAKQLLPDINSRNGLIKLNYRKSITEKYTYYGYVKSISKNYTKGSETSWELWRVNK